MSTEETLLSLTIENLLKEDTEENKVALKEAYIAWINADSITVPSKEYYELVMNQDYLYNV
jgi:hypothetical protein